MVDFNNEATIGTPSANVVKILLLQARANVLDALEFYNKQTSIGVDGNQAMLRARIGTWFMEHQAYLCRTLNPDDYTRLYDLVEKKIFFSTNDITKQEILSIIIELNKVMDKLRITKVDLRKDYNRTDIEMDNQENELS